MAKNGKISSSRSRMLSILDLFSIENPILRVEDVVSHLGVGQSTTYKYLKHLVESGILAQHGKGIYGLGRRIVQLERILQLSDPLLTVGRLMMNELESLANNRAFLLCAYYADAALCIHKIGPDIIDSDGNKMVIQRGRGSVLPLFTGAGSLVILAYLQPYKIKSLYLSSSKEILEAGLGSTWVEFRRFLSEIRKNEYAQTWGRINPEMNSIAVPIINSNGKVSGSLLSLGCSLEDNSEQKNKIIASLLFVAKQIGQEINEDW